MHNENEDDVQTMERTTTKARQKQWTIMINNSERINVQLQFVLSYDRAQSN